MTPEEAQAAVDHLSTTKTAWARASGGMHAFSNQRGDLVLFRNSRRNGTLRLYGWGGIGVFNTLVGARPALANPDLYDEVFPHAFYNFEVFNGNPVINPGFLPSVRLPHLINTEDHLETQAAHNPLQNIVSIAASYAANAVTAHMVVACTADGALYAHGFASLATPDSVFNPLGLGDFPFFNPDLPPIEGPTPRQQTALQRVYGKDASFSSVKFVKVQSCQSETVFIALDEDGHLWMSGNAVRFAAASDFEENSTNLMFFSQRAVTQYYDKTAALINEELLFTDFWVGFRSLLAITADGRLFGLGNRFSLGRQLDTTVFHEVGGFVDTVTVTNEGDFFSGDSGEAEFIEVAFSAPSDAYGETATGFALVENPGASNSKLKGIVITNPGWGYTSPPTISFTRGGGSPPAGFEEAEAECTIYTGTWKHASVAGHNTDASPTSVPNSGRLYFDHYVAVNEDGVVYSWGAISDLSFNAETQPGFALGKFFVEGPRRMLGAITLSALSGVPQPASYEKVFAGRCTVVVPLREPSPNTQVRSHNFGVAIDADGKLSFWGACPESAELTPSITPTLKRSADALTLLEPVAGERNDDLIEFGVFIDAACSERSVALVTSDHEIVTYGGLGTRGGNQFPHAPALGQGKSVYDEDELGEFLGQSIDPDDDLEKLRYMRRIAGGANFVRVFAVPGGRNLSGYYAVREPEELDPLYGTRISPRPPAEPLGEPD